MRITNQVRLVQLLTLAAVSVLSVSAQTAPAAKGEPRAEIAFTYNLVHTNAPPGGCGCFLMNGASGSFAYRFTRGISLVAEGGAITNSSAVAGQDLTLATYFDGARYSIRSSKRVTPFGQVLFGFSHAYGSLAPDRLGLDSSTAFAMSTGGGVDLNLTPHLAWRAAQADYLFTLFPNRTNGYQNNFRFQSGVVVRFGRR